MDLLTTAREQLPWLLVLVLPGFISIPLSGDVTELSRSLGF